MFRLPSSSHLVWSQSYKRNLIIEKTKLVLNALTVRYFDLDYIAVLLRSKLM